MTSNFQLTVEEIPRIFLHLLLIVSCAQVGKDFDAIVRLMAKRKMKKDKEQIRNYYYNTYKQTKLNAGFADEHPSDSTLELSLCNGFLTCTFLDFAFPVPREAKELFVLVNLAEWRKKTSDRKIEATKFRELILKGCAFFPKSLLIDNYSSSTSVRLKGKRVPVLIKTPACPALKKFCEGELVEMNADSYRSVLLRFGKHTVLTAKYFRAE
jgi:hypothetical protein